MSVSMAIALVSLFVSAVPSADRQDALDFSNGAILIEKSGSYGSGTASWAAWRLTDGSETDGWVVAALVKSGIVEARLRPKGHGLAQPVADNATAQGRALNRRVEVSVVK